MKKIVFTGDIALSGIISNFSEADSAEKLSISKFTDGGLAIINLEAPVAEEDAISNKRNGVVLRSSLNAMESFLIHNRIAAVTLANNHSLDYGFEGIKETISILDSFNIPHTGAGYLKEHLEPAIFKVEDTGYALLGYVHPDTNPFLEEGLSLNVYERERIKDSVRQSRKLADRVIVSLHWGRDYSKFPLPWQIEDAHIFIEAGADLVVGHHPHVIQPFEIYRGSYIFYSLGSTVFGDFYLRNRLRALPVKTKRSFVPLFTDLKEEPVFVPLRELKGNKLVVESGDIRKWSVRMMKWMRLKHRCRILSVIIDFKEKWVDKIWDVITGYYRNPFKDLFSREALKNAGRIMVGKDRMR